MLEKKKDRKGKGRQKMTTTMEKKKKKLFCISQKGMQYTRSQIRSEQSNLKYANSTELSKISINSGRQSQKGSDQSRFPDHLFCCHGGL